MGASRFVGFVAASVICFALRLDGVDARLLRLSKGSQREGIGLRSAKLPTRSPMLPARLSVSTAPLPAIECGTTLSDVTTQEGR